MLKIIGLRKPCRSVYRPAGSAKKTCVKANKASKTPTAAGL